MSRGKVCYTIDDVYNLPDTQRAELINGQMYLMEVPPTIHQQVVSHLIVQTGLYIRSYWRENKKVFSRLPVFLRLNDDDILLDPDIIICDRNKLDDRGCNGAPDWVIEVVQQSSITVDYYTKPYLYQTAGVREYWIVDPMRDVVMVYHIEKDASPIIYRFTDKVKSNIFPELEIDFSKMEL